MKFLPEAKLAYKFISVQISTIFATVAASWSVFPKEQQIQVLQQIGYNTPAWLASLSFFSLIYARWLSQPSTGVAPPETATELWSYWSVKTAAFFGLVSTVYASLPTEYQTILLSSTGFSTPSLSALSGFVLFVLARLVAQPTLSVK